MAMLTLAPVPLLRTAKADVQPSLCESIETLPEEVREFASMMCAVQQGIFADGRNPSLVFEFVEAVETPGTYEGTDAYGQELSFEAVQVITLPLYESAPDKFTPADAGYFCIGWLKGPAGKTAVAATCLRKESLTGDPIISAFIVTELLSDADVLASAQTERILAGLTTDVADINEVDGVTEGQSLPEDDEGSVLTTKATDELVLVTSTSHPNISVYVPPVGGMLPNIPEHSYGDCARNARYRHGYQDDQARIAHANCVANALITVLVEFGAIGIGSLLELGPLAPLGIGLAGALMLWHHKQLMDGCNNTFRTAQGTNNNQLAIDLADCLRKFPPAQPAP